MKNNGLIIFLEYGWKLVQKILTEEVGLLLSEIWESLSL